MLLILIMLAAALPAALGYLRASIYILKMADREKQIPSVFQHFVLPSSTDESFKAKCKCCNKELSGTIKSKLVETFW